MAYPTFVNDQITDAVTQNNVTTIAESASVATGQLFQAASSSLANAIQNAAFGQQQANVVGQATTTQGVNLLYAIDTEAVADATKKVSQADIPSDAINAILLKALMKPVVY
jgi:hypothetical protein